MEQDKGEWKEEQTAMHESGYSEIDQSLAIEVQSGQWLNVKKNPLFKRNNLQERIITMYQTVSNRIVILLGLYSQKQKENSFEADKALTEMKKLRMIQDILLNAALWEKNGELENDMLPEEVWEMIK